MVTIAPFYRRYLRFFWKGNQFEFLCLPFGLCSAPRVFTKIMKPVVSHFREKGKKMIIYLDDILILKSGYEEVL